MNKLPQRDDLIYKEIEEFQDYELTNCVAYEMAIRNEILIRILDDYLDTKDELIFGEDEKEYKLLNDYGFEGSSLFCYRISSFSSCRINYNSGMISANYSDGILFDKNKNNNIYLVDNVLINTSYENNQNNEINIIENMNINKNYIPSIHFGYARPLLKFKKNKIFNTEINLNLPKEELISYISKIKDEYDKDNSIIKTPLELLGETLEKSDNKKTPKKPKASVYADWFYIYDYWKYEKTQEKTDKDIFVALEVENDVPYKEDMLRKIRDKMKYFIDDLGYKELITGVKNS